MVIHDWTPKMKDFNTLASDIILRYSKSSTKNVAQHLIKLQEEVGELAVAYLMSVNKKGHTRTKAQIRENFIEEACDCILIILSLIGKAKYSRKQTIEMLNKKFNKFCVSKVK
jgi:NTP pyrophosphatase (non-canonical NTP hydrolase)